MKKLMKHENVYANTTIDSKDFSAIDIFNFLTGISQLRGLDISVQGTDRDDIIFTIGDDVYNPNGDMIENTNGYNSNFLIWRIFYRYKEKPPRWRFLL